MTAGTIVLLRHARTAYNAGLRLQGQIDIPLDEVGRWQAEQGATALAASHKASLVVSSDLERARHTAEAYARHIGVDVETDAGLRERSFGIWEGLTDAEIAERWPEEHAVWRGGGEPPVEGVESKSVVARRMEEAVLRHAEALGAGRPSWSCRTVRRSRRRSRGCSASTRRCGAGCTACTTCTGRTCGRPARGPRRPGGSSRTTWVPATRWTRGSRGPRRGSDRAHPDWIWSSAPVCID
nr:hypothetical protein GCM10025730_45350 [Promicromonospora thailandica]